MFWFSGSLQQKTPLSQKKGKIGNDAFLKLLYLFVT